MLKIIEYDIIDLTSGKRVPNSIGDNNNLLIFYKNCIRLPFNT